MSPEAVSAEGEHPEGSRLDLFAMDENAGDAPTRAHVAGCAACTAYVSALRHGAEAFAQREGTGPKAEAFVRGVRQRAARPSKRSPYRWMGAVAPVLAMAAAAILYVRTRGPEGTPDPIASVAPGEGPVRFKGGTQVATIVEHEGAQTRRLGAALDLVPGDRVRLEIAVDHDARIAAGILADDGEWAELQAPALFGAGTHYSEHAVGFDHDVPSGWVLAGEEEAIAHARRTHDFHDVTAIRVRQKPQ